MKQMSKIHVTTTVNGDPVEFLAEPRETLLDALRNHLDLTGTKEGCGTGDCGACSVTVDGTLVCSCLMLAAEANGKRVETIEGMAGEELHPLQRKFIEHAALQCGFCTPGILVAAKALLERNPDPTDTEVRYWLAGNLCRCTGYDKIIRAVQDAAAEHAGGCVMAKDELKTGYKLIGTRPNRPGRAGQGDGPGALWRGFLLAGDAAWAAVVRSPHAHARIVKIDASKALALDGVKAVVTRADLPTGLTGEDLNLQDNTLAGDKALYDGHAVAAVAATSALLAQDAARLIEVTYEVLPHVTDVDAAMAPDAPVIREGVADYSVPEGMNGNVARYMEFGHGDVEAGFAAADIVREQTYKTEATHQGYIEPHAAVAQMGEDGRGEMWVCTQGHWYIRRMCCRGAGDRGGEPAGDAVRNRRRLRRQDHDLHGAAAAGPVEEGGRASGQAGDEPVRGSAGDGADGLGLDGREAGDEERRHDHRRTGVLPHAGRGLPRDVADWRGAALRLCLLRHSGAEA
jgi:aerobic-type carbon monoxide dehydrogenase small subunit (CoxS/CutS family)